MRSETPKHLHPLLGKRLVDWVIDTARALGPEPIHWRPAVLILTAAVPT